MKKLLLLFTIIGFIAALAFQFNPSSNYRSFYDLQFSRFSAEQEKLFAIIKAADLSNSETKNNIIASIHLARTNLKIMDFWFRYLEPTVYKQINGPLPVEWETEVFEKHEKPYKRLGAGLSLAEIYLDESAIKRDSLLSLVHLSIEAEATYKADSITQKLNSYHHFYLCNRLFILNLANIYTTGFECPDKDQIIPELKIMLKGIKGIYQAYNESFHQYSLPKDYLLLYEQMIAFVEKEPIDFAHFNHFKFIQTYVNPLFALNQQLIVQYGIVTASNQDYTLNNNSVSIFSKTLFDAQNPKGIYRRITDPQVLQKIGEIGKLLFYDPILSGNNKRSCVSCHHSTAFFTDTLNRTAIHFDATNSLSRNTPSLINSIFYHLLHLDGKVLTVQEQAKTVMTNPNEMGAEQEELLKKILSCKTYKTAFTAFLRYTPEESVITFEHIASAITLYYGKFSEYYSPFDEAFNQQMQPRKEVIAGFNLFMSKAQCGICHFLPTFSGNKAPFISNEFEVVGVPADTGYHSLSKDSGRYLLFPANETLFAFRTPTLRNIAFTKPYMHNGVFTSLEQVIDFYDAGGGKGHGLEVPNQTLSPDSLHLSSFEKKQLISFLNSLTEKVIFELPPASLPVSNNRELNRRKIGGEY